MSVKNFIKNSGWGNWYLNQFIVKICFNWVLPLVSGPHQSPAINVESLFCDQGPRVTGDWTPRADIPWSGQTSIIWCGDHPLATGHKQMCLRSPDRRQAGMLSRPSEEQNIKMKYWRIRHHPNFPPVPVFVTPVFYCDICCLMDMSEAVLRLFVTKCLKPRKTIEWLAHY